MNNQEAKFILCAYRPNGRDARDAMFGEALKQAAADPALGTWFAREQAYDTAVAAKLGEIAPPAELRAAILAGARVSGANRTAAEQTRRTVWPRPAWLAMAAAIAVLIAVAGTLWPNRAAAKSELTRFAMEDASDPSKHGGHGEEQKALRAELSGASMRLDQNLRVDFAALAKTGCRTLDFGGRPVLEVCFKRNNTWFHCYVVRCEDFPSLPAKQGALFAELGRMNAATWSDGVHRFIVAGDAGREAIARLL